MSKKEYVLGTGEDENARLGIQHRVWADATTAVWKKAGIGPGTHVLDVGCGPGHASLDMAQLVTSSGKIVGIDESQTFVDVLNRKAKSWEIPQLSARVGDAENLRDCVNEKYDAVYCRWVLCWLKHPEKALAGFHEVLKPGGRLIIHDYYNWRAMGLGPRSAAMDKMVGAAVASFEKTGADIEISGRLPKMLRTAGFELPHFEVHQRVARGGGHDSTIAWPLTWWRTYGPKLVAGGFLSQKDNDQALSDLDVLEKSGDVFYFCPPLFEFVAVKK
jgi:ubiquinone/menaquinone biosynthesis C-methylase UbiE